MINTTRKQYENYGLVFRLIELELLSCRYDKNTIFPCVRVNQLNLKKKKKVLVVYIT